jgi:metal-responsive CopG/Arc/MetJ family transcriptional regulator
MEQAMATINFSVPEDVKAAFNETFNHQNKSAVITELMREAVERARSRQRSQGAIANILSRRDDAPLLTESAFRSAREDGRP